MIRFRIHDWSRDIRSEYLQACGQALEHQQRYQYERLKHRLVQEILPAFLRKQAA